MNRRAFLTQVATLPVTVSVPKPHFALPAPPPAGNRAPEASANLIGADARRSRLTLDRVLHGAGPAYTPEFLLEDIHGTPGRRFTNFSGDLSGRWIGALSSYAKLSGASFPQLHEVVRRTIVLQHPDGYFGKIFHFDHPDDNDLALLWGNGRLLVGLLEYHALTRNPDVLDAAKRLGDFLLRIAPRFNSPAMAEAFNADHYASSYVCWMQQTEGLAALYTATRDERYRDLCAAISLRSERRPGDHVHGYLTGLRGTLDLYRITGTQSHLDRVIAAWNDIQSSGDMLVTGGVPERWSPKRERTEGCAECDWLRLNLGLFHATGDQVYLDTAQDTYFNEFSMNQFATGDFGHARLDAAGVPETVYLRAWWCCTLHGLRAFADLQRAAFRIAADELWFNFPVDSQIRSTGFSATAVSALAQTGTVRIEIQQADSPRTLKVAKPLWADGVALTRNGHSVPGLAVESLSAGDIILVRYAMSPRGGTRPTPSQETGKQSLHFGPWLLGISSSANPEYFNELFADNRCDLRAALPKPTHPASVFEVPRAAAAVPFLPAEFPEQPANAELRAVAEQTANQPARWQLVFKPASNKPA